MALKCLLVDDEFNNRDLLRILIERYCPELQVSGMASSVMEAAEHIQRDPPQVVFLDVEMPGGDGFELLRRFPQARFCVVFVTAYQHYAIQALKTRAFDYLLKPVKTTDLKAVAVALATEFRERDEASRQDEFLGKIDQLLGEVSAGNLGGKSSGSLAGSVPANLGGGPKVFVPLNSGFKLLDVHEVEFLEADGNYTRIRLTDGSHVLVTRSIGEIEEELPPEHFYRCHKSYIINLQHLDGFSSAEGGVCRTRGGGVIPVSRRRQQEFMNKVLSISGRR